MKLHRLATTSAIRKNNQRAVTGGSTFALLAGSLALAPCCFAVKDLERGSVAPPLIIVDSDDTQTEILNDHGQVQVLLFGDSTHEPTFQSASIILNTLRNEQVESLHVEWFAILTKSSDVDVFRDRVADDAPPHPIVLHDLGRTAFGAFNVLVTPSVVVLDGKRRVVYAVAGPSPRFAEIFMASVLRAGNRLSEDEFLRVLTPPISTEPTDEEVRTDRWLRLARSLAANGQCDKAERAYGQALAISPSRHAAHFELTGLFLGKGDFVAAEAQLRALLELEPDYDDAATALCFVRLSRSDRAADEDEKIKQIAQKIAERHPDQASAQILLALTQARSAKADR